MVDEKNQVTGGQSDEQGGPPPPENFPPLGGNQNENINAGVPAVAAGRTKSIFALVAVVGVAVVVLFNMLAAPREAEKQEVQIQPAPARPENLPALAPEPPKAPPVAPPLPPVPAPPKPGLPTVSADKPKPASSSPQRVKAAMIVGGGGGGATGLELEGGAASSKKSGSYPKTAAQQVEATKAGDTDRMIAQGKIIDAVLETAINTDLSGILRAVVSRDVYAESGKIILVPKGSRLIGSYDTAVKRGQTRVYVIWNRVIRPDGIDMIITSPGSDLLGRAGVEGKVDNKYLEIFSNSILLSTLQVAFAYAAEEVTGADGVSEKENTTGSVTTSGSPTDLAVADAVNQFGSTVKSITGDLVNIKPTITVDQGTRLKVFVNKDVIFPPEVTGNNTLVIR
jgi:type IV secretion system protein VirB10